MISGIHPIITFLISWLLFFAVIGAAPAQDTLPLDCVMDMDNPTLQVWGHPNLSYSISADIWQQLTEIDGDSIWIGYDAGGWSVPNDIVGAWKITGDNGNSEIWVWQSENEYAYYVFPFANTELFADGNGNHYGMHPCGGWQITRSDLNLLIIDIINSAKQEE